MATRLGQPFMPHQRMIADVGGEIDPQTGLPAYREVIVSLPRQEGKTTLFVAWQIHRCTAPRWAHPQRSVFTAQSGRDARDKWLDEIFPLLRNSRVSSLIARRRGRLAINEGMGNEHVRWRTGSLIRLLSTSASSGHSKTVHQSVLDEIWKDTDDRREQGLRPAMINAQDAQLLVCSTAGTAASVILNRKLAAGRKAVQADSGHGIAFFDWGAPDGWDPYDDASYFGFMPALCPDPPCRCGVDDGGWRHTKTLDTILGERDSDMPAEEFARAYGNIPATGVRGQWAVIPREPWDNLALETSRALDPVAFGVATTRDGTFTAVGVAGRRRDGLLHVEVIRHEPGTRWVVDYMAERHRKWSPCAVVVDPGSTTGQLITSLEAAGVPVVTTSTREVAQACGQFASAVTEYPPELRHLGQEELDAALAGVGQRKLGDKGQWAWDDQDMSVDISPLWAVTLAAWGHGAHSTEVEELDGPLGA
ncbi:MAG: hypothetical protein ACOC9R_02505 [bacterium]